MGFLEIEKGRKLFGVAYKVFIIYCLAYYVLIALVSSRILIHIGVYFCVFAIFTLLQLWLIVSCSRRNTFRRVACIIVAIIKAIATVAMTIYVEYPSMSNWYPLVLAVLFMALVIFICVVELYVMIANRDMNTACNNKAGAMKLDEIAKGKKFFKVTYIIFALYCLAFYIALSIKGATFLNQTVIYYGIFSLFSLLGVWIYVTYAHICKFGYVVSIIISIIKAVVLLCVTFAVDYMNICAGYFVLPIIIFMSLLVVVCIAELYVIIGSRKALSVSCDGADDE